MLSMLVTTLPTRPNAVRLRLWRSLKALGCAALRDGAYLLPAEQAALFEPLADEVRSHGGTAMVLALAPIDEAQRAALQALFDRREAHAHWLEAARALQAALPKLDETEARRRWRGLQDALAALQRIDHYPNAAADQSLAGRDALRQALDARFSHGEPAARASAALPRLDARQFQRKRWATRARPWADRLACAWLIRRFIDPQARFLWLADPAGATPPPRGALGFDYDGARFSHVGERISLEVLIASFGLVHDKALQRIAAAVHCLDVGGPVVAEAAGLEAVLAGLRALHADDDALLAAAAAVFDALHASPLPAATGSPP